MSVVLYGPHHGGLEAITPRTATGRAKATPAQPSYTAAGFPNGHPRFGRGGCVTDQRGSLREQQHQDRLYCIS